MSIFLNAKAVAPKRDGFSGSAKSLAEFAPAGVNRVQNIFAGGVYVGENQPSTGRKPMRRTGKSFRCFLPFSPWRATDAPASKRTKNPRKFKAVRCEAVLPEQKCSQTRKRPQRILCVFSRALTQYEGISARQNRVCPCQSTLAICELFFKTAHSLLHLQRACAIL